MKPNSFRNYVYDHFEQIEEGDEFMSPQIKKLDVIRLICPMCEGTVDPDTLMCGSCHDHADPGVKVCACERCKGEAFEDTWTESDGMIFCEGCAETMLGKCDPVETLEEE